MPLTQTPLRVKFIALPYCVFTALFLRITLENKKKCMIWEGGVLPYILKCGHICLRDTELPFSGIRTNTWVFNILMSYLSDKRAHDQVREEKLSPRSRNLKRDLGFLAAKMSRQVTQAGDGLNATKGPLVCLGNECPWIKVYYLLRLCWWAMSYLHAG